MIQEKNKILIVEDEEAILRSLSDHFRRLGYELAVAHDGEEGMRKALEFKPNLILLDIIMPVMDGISMLKKMKENSELQRIPVIILTNLDSNEKVAEAIESGGTQYLIKANFDLEDLEKKVQEIIK